MAVRCGGPRGTATPTGLTRRGAFGVEERPNRPRRCRSESTYRGARGVCGSPALRGAKSCFLPLIALFFFFFAAVVVLALRAAVPFLFTLLTRSSRSLPMSTPPPLFSLCPPPLARCLVVMLAFATTIKEARVTARAVRNLPWSSELWCRRLRSLERLRLAGGTAAEASPGDGDGDGGKGKGEDEGEEAVVAAGAAGRGAAAEVRAVWREALASHLPSPDDYVKASGRRPLALRLSWCS